jgi:hypothetical protein
VRSLLIRSALILGSVAFAVGSAEVILRVMLFGEAGVNLSQFMEYDPLLGWRHKKNISGVLDGQRNEYHTTLQYNARGMRGPDRPYRKPQNVSRILVIGDSNVDAYAVQVQDRFAELLETALGPQVQVIPLGVSAYSTDQKLLLLEQEGWKYQPDLLILEVSHLDVWYNNQPRLKGSGPSQWKPLFVIDNSGTLSLTNVPVPRPHVSLRERFKFCSLIVHILNKVTFLFSPANPLPQAEQKTSWRDLILYQRTETPEIRKCWVVTQALLRRISQEAVQRGLRVLVLYWPARAEVYPESWRDFHFPPDFDPGQVAKDFARICKAEGIPYIDPTDRFRKVAQQNSLYYLHDPHWNPAGNRLAASILAEYLADPSPYRSVKANPAAGKRTSGVDLPKSLIQLGSASDAALRAQAGPR